MSLKMPLAMLVMPIGNVRKFFKWADLAPSLNRESIRRYFAYIPMISDELKWAWEVAGREMVQQWQSEEFDSHGDKITDRDEKKRRRAFNKSLEAAEKAARADYERFQKRIPKLEEIRDQLFSTQ